MRGCELVETGDLRIKLVGGRPNTGPLSLGTSSPAHTHRRPRPGRCRAIIVRQSLR